jgi:NAD(P)-dependent dehydrogenase (short-subunit alcohol dehydrogenase family)
LESGIGNRGTAREETRIGPEAVDQEDAQAHVPEREGTMRVLSRVAAAWTTLVQDLQEQVVDLDLTDRVVYVSGGSRGVGRAVVERLLTEGAMVATCARDASALQSSFPGAPGGRLLIGACDVRDRQAVHADIARAANHFGRLDSVVANAGAGTAGSFLNMTTDELDAQISVKVHSLMHIVEAARHHLVKSTGPAIVVVNGVTAHAPESDLAAVGIARAAVANAVYLLARELAAEGVRVNAVNLGAIVTDRQRQRHVDSRSGEEFEEWCLREAQRRAIPLKRMGRPEEVAPVVAFLLSPLSSYITGASVDVSGGLGVRP